MYYCSVKQYYRYEDHLRTCATLVAAEQGNINKQVIDRLVSCSL